MRGQEDQGEEVRGELGGTLTFRAFSRRFCPMQLTISTCVRRKCNSKSLSVQ